MGPKADVLGDPSSVNQEAGLPYIGGQAMLLPLLPGQWCSAGMSIPRDYSTMRMLSLLQWPLSQKSVVR